MLGHRSSIATADEQRHHLRSRRECAGAAEETKVSPQPQTGS